MRSTPMRAGIVNLLLLLATQGAANAQSNRARQLVPVARQVVELSEGLEVSGGALGQDRAVLWSRPSGTVHVVFQGTLSGVCSSVRISPIAAALVRGDTVVEIVDGSSGAIWRGAVDGSCIQALGVPSSGAVIAAARCEGWWIALLLRGDGALRILAQESAEWREQLVLSSLLPHASDGRDIHLTCPKGVLMSSSVYPFDWVYVDPTGHITKGRPAGLERLFHSPNAIPPAIVGLRMGLLDSGFVQILGNMRDDRRLIVAYDTSGMPVSAHAVSVPMGLLDTRLEPARALALQRAPGLGLAFVEWHWQPINPPEGEP